MGVQSSLEALPGTIVCAQQQLTALSGEECRRQLAAEGVNVGDLGDKDAKLRLERARGARYCALFLPSIATALAAWAAVALLLRAEGPALVVMALVPAPMILTL